MSLNSDPTWVRVQLTPYTGKTLAVQALAIAVASRRRAWGRFEVAQGRVRHFDYEQGRALTSLRYQRLARGCGIDESEIAGQLELASLPAVYIDAHDAGAHILRACDGIALAIFDSFRAAAPSVDENSSDARRVLDTLTRISERTNCVMIVVHHARKPHHGTRGGARMEMRGTGALYDAAGSVLILTGEKDSPSVVHHEKARISGRLRDDFAIEIEDVEIDNDARAGLRVVATNADGACQEASDERTERLCERVFDFVASHRGCSYREIRAGVSGGNEAIGAALDRLERNGDVKNAGAANRQKWIATAADGS